MSVDSVGDRQGWEREKGHREENVEVERKVQEVVVPGFGTV